MSGKNSFFAHSKIHMVRYLWIGWMVCWGFLTVALAGRLGDGPVTWVRQIWMIGLIIAMVLLVVAFVISLVYGVRLIVNQWRLLRTAPTPSQRTTDSHESRPHD